MKRTACPLCAKDERALILDRGDTIVWTNAEDDPRGGRKRHPCRLEQCLSCGHVFQPLTADLGRMLSDLYTSQRAQATTAMGKGNWGIARARDFMKMLGSLDGFSACSSAAEIGCADGHILKELKKSGFSTLIGIEPSIGSSYEEDGIRFLGRFADKELTLGDRVDLIYSAWSFEHIEALTDILTFCGRNLKERGRLFFVVPNAQVQLENGDPALFLHQHVHYFTPDALTRLLGSSGFSVSDMRISPDNLAVTAVLDGKGGSAPPVPVKVHEGYSRLLDGLLERAGRILEERPIVHGANQSLSNILCWLGRDYDFVLADNDSTKQGRTYLGKKVHGLHDLDLSSFKTALVVPAAFFDEIRADYKKRGFQGRIEGVIPEGQRRPTHD